MLNIAHRGASADFPENTLAAFAGAIAAGAGVCELDVHRTADGEIVVIHDDTLDRTSDGRGKVAELTFAQLRKFSAGGWFSTAFAAERIPLLREVLELVHGRCALNIELKAAGLTKQVCTMIRGARVEESTLVSSFDANALAEVRALAPEIRVGLLTSRMPARSLARALQLKAAAINPAFELASADFCARAHLHGLAIYPWTVDDPDVMRKLISAGVDGIMTNHPARLRAVMQS
ncbi:MAG TPA: glycerophosphodiester phosphodiesterase family protein [Candidatus Binataceae bacterium]|nr:glycerophosphodiester phosphodiesterase family protein [Candidatus Binataceae bacterium]